MFTRPKQVSHDLLREPEIILREEDVDRHLAIRALV